MGVVSTIITTTSSRYNLKIVSELERRTSFPVSLMYFNASDTFTMIHFIRVLQQVKRCTVKRKRPKEFLPSVYRSQFVLEFPTKFNYGVTESTIFTIFRNIVIDTT